MPCPIYLQKIVGSFGKKSEEMRLLKKRVEELNKRNLGVFTPNFQTLEREWAKLEKMLKQSEEKPGRSGNSRTGREKSKIPIPQTKTAASPKEDAKIANEEPVIKVSTVPVKAKGPHITTWSPEVVTKVNRLREQVAAISRSLASSEDVFVSCFVLSSYVASYFL